MTRETSASGPGGYGDCWDHSDTKIYLAGGAVSRKGLQRDLGISMSAQARDADLRRAVLVSLISDPCLKTRHIGVAVRGGVVTLSGYVNCHAQKDAAGAAARRVKGVDRITDALGVAVPCADDGEAAPDGADLRHTLTLPGALARAAGAREPAPHEARSDDRL